MDHFYSNIEHHSDCILFPRNISDHVRGLSGHQFVCTVGHNGDHSLIDCSNRSNLVSVLDRIDTSVWSYLLILSSIDESLLVLVIILLDTTVLFDCVHHSSKWNQNELMID